MLGFRNVWAKDCINAKTICHIDIIDRIKILFFGQFYIYTETECENLVGKAEQRVTVTFPFILKHKSVPMECEPK